MGRTRLALIVAALPLLGQFGEMAVTDDGRLLFVSTHRLDSEPDDARTSRVYQFTGDGVSRFALSPDGRPAGAPFISGDGAVHGYAVHTPCAGSCMFAFPRTRFHIVGPEPGEIQANTLQLSRNARYLLAQGMFGPGLRFLTQRIDRDTGEILEDSRIPASSQAITNSGAYLALSAHGTECLSLRRISPGEDRDLAPGSCVVTGSISANGAAIAYERTSAGRRELIAAGGAGESPAVIASVSREQPLPFPIFTHRFSPSFSNDGALLWLEFDPETCTGQPMVRPLTGEARRLATIPEGVATAVLSGNGELAWIVTAAGRLLRVRTADGAVDEMIGPTPMVPSGQFATPGSVVRLRGSGLTPGLRVQLNHTDLPVTELAAEEAVVQIPWETPIAAGGQSLVVQGERSPFRQAIDLSVVEPRVTFERAASISGPGLLQAAHQNFRGVLTEADPPAPARRSISSPETSAPSTRP